MLNELDYNKVKAGCCEHPACATRPKRAVAPKKYYFFLEDLPFLLDALQVVFFFAFLCGQLMKNQDDCLVYKGLGSFDKNYNQNIYFGHPPSP